MSEESLKSVLQDNSKEMLSSLDSLMKKHGSAAVMFAMSMVNCPKFLRMAKDAGLSEELIYMLEQQFKMMMNGWAEAAHFKESDIAPLTNGLRGQMAVFEQDIMEAVPPADGGSTPTKEH